MPMEEAHRTAFRIVRDRLKDVDIGERCERSGAVYRPQEGIVEIAFIGRTCRIGWAGMEGAFVEGEELSLRERILLLHYLDRASGVPASGLEITFAQLPGVEVYLPVFRARTIDRVVRSFGRRPELLVEAARTLGGHEVEYGDVGMVIPALPRVSITFVLWLGDDEFEPAGNILFDSRIGEYLPTEDVIVASEMIVSRLCAYAKQENRT